MKSLVASRSVATSFWLLSLLLLPRNSWRSTTPTLLVSPSSQVSSPSCPLAPSCVFALLERMPSRLVARSWERPTRWLPFLVPSVVTLVLMLVVTSAMDLIALRVRRRRLLSGSPKVSFPTTKPSTPGSTNNLISFIYS